MCNLYSITTNQAATIALFRLVNRYVGRAQRRAGATPPLELRMIPQMGALRTLTVCGFAELTRKLFHKGFSLPLRAIGFDDISGTSKSMALGGGVTDADSHIAVERTNCYGTGRPQRIAHG
jgi:hypothetical protein